MELGSFEVRLRPAMPLEVIRRPLAGDLGTDPHGLSFQFNADGLPMTPDRFQAGVDIDGRTGARLGLDGTSQKTLPPARRKLTFLIRYLPPCIAASQEIFRPLWLYGEFAGKRCTHRVSSYFIESTRLFL